MLGARSANAKLRKLRIVCSPRKAGGISFRNPVEASLWLVAGLLVIHTDAQACNTGRV